MASYSPACTVYDSCHTQGIGRGVALALASAGAHVVVADVRAAKDEEVAGEVHGIGLGCDVRDTAQISAVVDAAVERFGRVDILVNSAIPKFDVKPLVEF